MIFIERDKVTKRLIQIIDSTIKGEITSYFSNRKMSLSITNIRQAVSESLLGDDNTYHSYMNILGNGIISGNVSQDRMIGLVPNAGVYKTFTEHGLEIGSNHISFHSMTESQEDNKLVNVAIQINFSVKYEMTKTDNDINGTPIEFDENIGNVVYDGPITAHTIVDDEVPRIKL